MSEPTSTTFAALLGALQGVTEFLPVSSSGHLALAEHLFGLTDGGLTLNVLLHGGTLLATFVVLRARIARALLATLAALRSPGGLAQSEGGRDALFVLLATIPTGIIGLSLHDAVDALTHSPFAVGCGLLVTTALLLSVAFLPGGKLEVPPWWGALLIGVAQGIAVCPGISRSGTTIAVALWLGVRPGRAFELSMLMSLPVVFGAVLLESRKMLRDTSGVSAAGVGAAVAFATGIVALLLLRGVVARGRFPAFALWTGPVALLALYLGLRA